MLKCVTFGCLCSNTQIFCNIWNVCADARRYLLETLCPRPNKIALLCSALHLTVRKRSAIEVFLVENILWFRIISFTGDNLYKIYGLQISFIWDGLNSNSGVQQILSFTDNFLHSVFSVKKIVCDQRMSWLWDHIPYITLYQDQQGYPV